MENITILINFIVHSETSLTVELASVGFELSESWSEPWRGAGKREGSGFKWGKIVQEVMEAVVAVEYQFIRGGTAVSVEGVDAS